MKKSIIVETELYLIYDEPQKTDSENIEDFINDLNTGNKEEIIYTSKFTFDFSDVMQIYTDADKTILKFINGEFCVKMSYEEALELFSRSRGFKA